jgi:hypothetical protein
MLSHTLTQTLVRWIVDLNFGTDVAAPVLTREFRIEESPLTMPDVSLLIQSGYTPRKEWIERHFRVELEEKKEGEGAEEEATTFDPQKDQDLFGSIFGGDQPESTGGGAGAAEANQELQAAADVMETPKGATPEESQSDAIGEPSAEDEMDAVLGEMDSPAPGEEPEESQTDTDLSDDDIYNLLGLDDEEDEPQKPFGDETISEDEAVEMDK